MLPLLKSLTAISAIISAALAYPQQSSPQQITQDLRGTLSKNAGIYFPSDTNYDNETIQRWTIYEPDVPTYVAAIKPATEADISTTVKTANKYNISYLATGGGHGLSTTLGRLHNGISIDMGSFKKVDVNTAAGTVTLGGGNIFRDAIQPVFDAGFEIVTGSCACVGAAGATIGGGVGRLQGLHGLIVDNVVSYKVVIANGDIVQASDSQNSDLLWAMRGAGHNFGIVLEVTYKIHKSTNDGKALNADLIFPASANHTHWQLLKNISTSLPAELTMFSGINYNKSVGGINILFNVVYYGPEDKGRAFLAPFLANKPVVTSISYIDAKEIIPTSLFGKWWDPACKKKNYVNTYTVGLKQIDIPTFDRHFSDMAAYYARYPQAQSSTIYYETFPTQGVRAVPQGFSAYPSSHREIQTHVLSTYNYNDQSIDADVNAFARSNRDMFAKASGFSELELYTTYAHGDEGPEVWYRDSLLQLRSLKQKYDPDNRFRFFNPIVS